MNRASEEPRRGYAYLDLPSRILKARKIERLLSLQDRRGRISILEVGTGSGGIAHYFATHPTLETEVVAVDVRDSRVVLEGYDFQLVQGTELPFEDASFDVILTNHVIEHVGPVDEQRRHLCEIRRLLVSGGVGYLAVPNRWMLVEPHYHLPLLSWLPKAWRSQYVRAMSRGARYDCEPLTMNEVQSLIRSSDLEFQDITIEALRQYADLEEGVSKIVALAGRMPNGFLRTFRKLIPTHVYRLSRPLPDGYRLRGKR